MPSSQLLVLVFPLEKKKQDRLILHFLKLLFLMKRVCVNIYMCACIFVYVYGYARARVCVCTTEETEALKK